MSNHPTPSPEIWELMNRVTDRVASGDEVHRLANWLDGHDGRQDLFLDYCEMHVQLSLDAGMDRVRSRVLEYLQKPPIAPVFSDSSDFDVLAPSPPNPGWPFGVRSVFLPLLGMLAISCALVIALLAGRGGREADRPLMPALAEQAPVPAEQVAVVTEAVEAAWLSVQPQSLPMVVRAGDLIELASGLVELRFTSDATVIVKGPAKLEALSSTRVAAHRGCITARVEDATIGFVVETPNAKVVDLGTEFGVDVTESGETNVVVLDGSVDVVTESAKQTSRLTKGEGIKAGSLGALERIVWIQSGDFPTTTNVPVQTRPPVIKAVRDNLRGLDSLKFYEIVHGGLTEDVQAYVDRFHEWNGIDKSGIPKFLLGGDYVKMFNEDKLQENIEISVEFAEAAELYLFVDDRSEPPDWLKKEFMDTGTQIGLDEALQVEKGPGVSIDSVFSVWKRRIFEPGVVTLGSIRRHGDAVYNCMYGIVATPLRTSEDVTIKKTPPVAASQQR